MIKDVISVTVIFIIGTILLYIIAIGAPTNEKEQNSTLSFPNNLSQLRSIAALLQEYYKNNWEYVLLLFSAAYIYKQSFMIPGSALLNILGGAIFGVKIALPLCCFLSGCGATISYLISKNFGKHLIEKLWPHKLLILRAKVAGHNSSLFSYLLFLRLFPMSPNWLINVLCPLIGVPWKTFFFTVMLGLLPYNFVCIQAGEMLSNITSLNEIFTMTVFFQLAAISIVSLVPSWYLKERPVA